MKGPLREVRDEDEFKDSDVDIVEEDIDDELYNRKKEILKRYVIKSVPKNENKYLFYLKFKDENKDKDSNIKFKFDRSLKYKRTYRGIDKYYDSLLKKEVDRFNSGFVLALAEWIKLRRIIPIGGWNESTETSCCKYRRIKIPDNHDIVSRYIEYKSRFGDRWSYNSRFILVSIDGIVILKPSRKKKLIRKLVNAGASKKKMAKFFKLSYSRIRTITKGIKQKKYKPKNGNFC